MKPENILAVTFSRRAATEIEDRIGKAFGEHNEITVGTFHSIGYSILQEFGQQVGVDPDFTVLNEADQKRLSTSPNTHARARTSPPLSQMPVF